MAEIEPYAHEPLHENESESDEGGFGEPDQAKVILNGVNVIIKSTADFVFRDRRSAQNVFQIDSFNQFSVKS